jgi:hypothetical protein
MEPGSHEPGLFNGRLGQDEQDGQDGQDSDAPPRTRSSCKSCSSCQKTPPAVHESPANPIARDMTTRSPRSGHSHHSCHRASHHPNYHAISDPMGDRTRRREAAKLGSHISYSPLAASRDQRLPSHRAQHRILSDAFPCLPPTRTFPPVREHHATPFNSARRNVREEMSGLRTHTTHSPPPAHC